MQKFIKNIAIVIGLFAILNYIIYLSLTNKLIYKDYESYKVDLLETEYSTLIFADSHGWSLTKESEQLKQRLRSNGIYNMSYGSDSYGDILAKITWIINNNIQCHTIILSVDDHMLTKHASNKYRTIAYTSASSFSNIYNSNKASYYYYWLIRYFPTLYPSNQQLITTFLKSKTPLVSKANDDMEMLSQQKKEINITKKVENFFPSMSFKPKKQLYNNLKAITEICENNNIEIIGIKFPIDPFMNALYSKIKVLDSVKLIASRFRVSSFLNYQTSFNSPLLLGNEDHVNVLGAELIVDELIKISN